MNKFINLLFSSAVITVAAQGSGPQVTGSYPSTLPKILPSSPEAFKLGSYGNIPVSLFTGTANINIPLTNYKAGNLSLPVALSYGSNGIKIDDMNGSTGLGWNLITAGVITRTIRDLPDEENVNISFPNDIGTLGVRHPTVMQYFQDASNDLVDSEQDLYMANFNGNSIKFVFDRRGTPIVYSQKDVIIEGQSGGSSFTITMDDGIKYYFTDKETTENRTLGDGHSLLSSNTTAWYLTKIEDPSNGEQIIIENQNAGYSATLSNSQMMRYTLGAAQPSVCGGSAFSLPPVVGGLISHLQSVGGKQVKRIYSNNPNYGEITFEYTTSTGNEDYQKLSKVVRKLNSVTINDINFNYTLTANKRLFLNSINDNISKAVHSFEYTNPEELPVRLSFARDTGGYYNGISTNTNLIPQLSIPSVSYPGATQGVVPTKSQVGMLKKIIYPTKGNSEFSYENHTQKQYKLITPGQSNGLSIAAESTDTDVTNPNITKSETFTSIKDEEIMLGGSASFNATKCDPSLQVTGKHRAVVKLTKPSGELIPFYIKNQGGSTTAIGTTFVLPLNGNTFYAQIPKNLLLKLSITTSFECTRSSVATNYTAAEAVYGDVQTDIPGVRISKIIDNSESGVATTRKFIYKDIGESFSNATVVREPVFTEGLNKTRTCVQDPPPGGTGGGIPWGVERFTYYALTSSNINQLNATHPNLFYKTVQEVIDGKSTIVHQYSIESDYFGQILRGADIKSAPWTNFGWSNGNEILTKYLDNGNNLVRTVEMNYEEDTTRKTQVDGFAIRKNYDVPVSMNVTQTCTAENINATYEQTYCTTNHNHFRKSADGYKNCYTPGANNVTLLYKHQCYGKNIGDVIAFDDQLDNLDIVQYKNVSYFNYLKSQKSTDYLGGEAVKTETQYFYNNPLHHQLTSQKTIQPDASFNEAAYKYAHEKGNQLMLDKNMIAVPLETTTTQTVGSTVKTLSKTETLYPTALPTTQTGSLLLPLSQKSYDKLNSAASTDITYDKYDSKGNILQYTTKDGMPVAIVWGYNNTQPIAKVEGATYTQLESLGIVPAIVTASDSDATTPANEPALITALDNFRKNTGLSAYQVTTFTYDPLIGVTSITPPTGIREVYTYDTANRLKEVKIREKDSTGSYVFKKVKEYNYNYKQ
ncbi:hypothetical protein [Chryseobacterium tongliaoense]|uniref:hypothetical protein n=1 Tax=Chryseobacterium tongliaoense TaxID=3240933 RepID=UPI003518D61F